MKKTLSVFITLVIILTLFGCAKGSNTDVKSDQTKVENETTISTQKNTKKHYSELIDKSEKIDNSSNILIAYFSATGSTAQVADFIRINTDGVMFEIEPQLPYTAEDLDYSNNKCRSKTEQNDDKMRVEINSIPSNMGDFDIVYIGYPIWYGYAPKAVYTFIENVDLSGKTIIPFCTSEQTGIKDSVKDIKKLAPNSKWKSGKRFKPSTTLKDVNAWLN